MCEGWRKSEGGGMMGGWGMLVEVWGGERFGIGGGVVERGG